jgi:hypothetical protein
MNTSKEDVTLNGESLSEIANLNIETLQDKLILEVLAGTYKIQTKLN